MENGPKPSSSHPQVPHRNTEKRIGDEKQGNSKGHFNRHKRTDRQQGNRDDRPFNRVENARNRHKGGRKPPKKRHENLPPIVSDDQITEGKLRGQKISVSPSPKMAPTGRRLREILFRILYRRVRAGRFLDLCAGAGSVGIDAISRNALLVTMVERKAKNCSLIRENLKNLGISEGHGETVEAEVIPFLKQMKDRGRVWDVVYFAPPYDFEYDEALEFFAVGATIKKGGVFVIEHHAEMFFPESIGELKRWKVVIEDDSAMSFYDRRS